MHGYDLYTTYQAIRLHFTSPDYNFYRYGGKTKVSRETFEKKQDKYFYHRLAKKYNDDQFVPFLVSNFINSKDTWIKSLVSKKADDTYVAWKAVIDNLEVEYVNDLQKLHLTKDNFDNMFESLNGKYPLLLVKYNQKIIRLETMVILNDLFNYIIIWDRKINDDIIYPQLARKITKYSPFLKIDVVKYKSLTLNSLQT